jgi:hypothetical protein
MAPKKHFICRDRSVYPIDSTVRHWTRRADLQDNASVQSKHNDNSDTVFVRQVFSAAIFPRVGAKRSEEGRNADDERREMVREGA